jgi:hypothetical protein
MSLLPTTPNLFQRGIQAFTNLFRPKSEPSPLNGIQQGIQQSAEVNKVRIDEEVKEASENIDNLKILSKPVPDIPDVRYFPHDAEDRPVPHVTYVPQLNVAEMKLLLENDAAIDDKIARSVAPSIEQQYDETQNRRFNEVLDEFKKMCDDETQYKTQCREGIQVELRGALTGCFITPQEGLLPYAGLSDEFYSRITKYFGDECSRYAARWVGRITDSWLPDVSPRSAETFFKRTALYLDALKAYNLFNTPNWRRYKSHEYARMHQKLTPSLPFWTMQYEREWREEWAKENPSLSPPPPDLPDPEPFVPPGGPANPGYNLRINIDPYYYVVGPIVEFENIEGRTLIYVKCYDDSSYTTGIYFWVYLSQSEGKFRVFFKLRANSIIEKGFDYTQGTLVDFRLQGILSRYYNMHYSRGKQHPIKINTLKRVIYFVDNMPYLQSRFLDNFPLPLLMYADNSACCRVFPPPPLPPPPYTRDRLGRVKGLVCHYYLIHKKYNAIFHKGFPLVDHEINDFFPPTTNHDDGQYCRALMDMGRITQRPVDTNMFKDFLKGPVGGAQAFSITEPLIYCFTTSCPKTTLVSFDDLLNVMNYTATIWFQGLQNFTKRCNGMLSPVLYVIIGAMVERPDFELSSIRDQMLGFSDSAINLAPLSVRDYKKHSAALMTLGTEEFRPAEPTLYLPASPPARTAAIQAYVARPQPYDFVPEIKKQIDHVTHKVDEVLRGIPPNIPPPIPDTDIKKHLIDFGLLAIKADWLKRKFDDSYEARNSVFPDSVDDTKNTLDGHAKIKKMEVYCLCNDNTFLKLPENVCCLDPNTTFLQTLPSRFNETRVKDYDNPAHGQVNVVVDTLAQQYCMKFSYVTTPENKVKEMYVMIQLSSTIVYTLRTPDYDFNKIVYAIDMQKTPIACLPEYTLNETDASDARAYQVIIQTQAQAGGGGHKYANTPQEKEKAAAAARARAAQTAQQQGLAAPNAPNARDAGVEKDNAGVGKDKAGSKKTTAIQERKAEAAKAAEQKRQAEAKVIAEQNRQAEQKRQAEAKVVAEQIRQAEEKRQAEQNKILDNLQAVLSTDRTMLSTPKRVSSWGAFFAGKMMEYLFGQYFQLPTLFKLYARWLQVCHAYYTTALIYNYNTSRPCVFFDATPAGKSHSFATLFAAKLTSEGFKAPPAPGAAVPQDTFAYVSKRLEEHTAAIKLIGENVTAPFLDYTPEDAPTTVASSSVSSDASSRSVSPDVSSRSVSPDVSSSVSSDSTSSTGSHFPTKRRKSSEQNPYQPLLLSGSLPSQESDDSWKPHNSRKRARSRSGSRSRSPKKLHVNLPVIFGGSLITNKSTNRCKTKRKNRKTTRKNGKVNRIIKKYNKNRKTYRRKVNGRKLKGNNCKNNKTMRRYRRVRK